MQNIFPINGEFSFIEKIAAQQSSFKNTKTGVYGIGDDAAIIGDLALSVDTSVEDIHFSLRWGTITEAFEKALISNISDINAMGADATNALLALGIPKNWSEIKKQQLVDAITFCSHKYQIDIIGGDTVASSNDKCFFSITIMGHLKFKPLFRSRAQIGHKVYVSNKLGKSLAGLKLLEENNYNLFPELVNYHKIPNIPLGLGAKLASFSEIGACIDISDGLASELKHISLQSNVKISIYEKKFVFDELLVKFCVHFRESLSSFYLKSGEEYQLLFTMPEYMEKYLLDFDIYQIGNVSKGEGVEFIDYNGKISELDAIGWSHF